MGLSFDPARRTEDMAVQLTAYGSRAVELEPVLEDIAELMMIAEMRIFETRGASSGRYWSPLRGTTIAVKKRMNLAGSPYDPLIREGGLRESLTVEGAPYQVLEIDDNSLHFGTTHPSAQYHAEGTSYMPARPPLIVTKKAANEYIKRIKDFVFMEGEYSE
jgi:phage gpG-like protein